MKLTEPQRLLEPIDERREMVADHAGRFGSPGARFYPAPPRRFGLFALLA
jgi:hypothetical protein